MTTLPPPIGPPQVAFSNDLPLIGKEFDRLNRAPFADRIANVILGLPMGTGLVVGVHGPWGDGKTSVLNMLRSRFATAADTIAVDFNPWRFTDEPAMLVAFFRALADCVSTKLTTKAEDAAALVERLARYASVIDSRASAAADVAAKIADSGLEETRRRLSEALSSASKRIVVLVDDIDRLERHEAHTVFRLIKASTDLPNVSYILAFDDSAVAAAIGDRYGSGDESAGRAFLEKIIQVPLHLPAAAREDLRSLCFEQVDRALDAAGIVLTSNQTGEFVARFDRSAFIRLQTPRSVKRYGNALMFALPALKAEANAVDVLLVEALRAFFPEIYALVRDNQEYFAGVEGASHGGAGGPSRAPSLLEPLLGRMTSDDGEAAKNLLVDLFPRLSAAYRRTSFGPDWLTRWSREQRACAPEYCPRYFTYAVLQNDVPDEQIRTVLESAGKSHRDFVRDQLQGLLTPRKARRAIAKLRLHEESACSEAAEVLTEVLASLGGLLPNPPVLFGAAEAPAQTGILVAKLLRRISDRPKRRSAAARVIEAAQPLWFGLECLRWFHISSDPSKEELNALSVEEVGELERQLVTRIKRSAGDGAPLFDPDVPQEISLLFEWRRAEGQGSTHRHLVSLFERDPTQIARFLRANAPRTWGSGEVLPRTGDLSARVVKNIQFVMDLEQMAAFIEKHCPGNFREPRWHHEEGTDEDQRLAEQFMYVLAKWRTEGEPPEEVMEV